MNLHLHRPLGLAGRILAILLLTVTVEFLTSTFLYERSSQFSLREDEAHRLAEHLVITRKLIAERPRHERPMMAALLTTDRYEVHWNRALPATPRLAPELGEMRKQILNWEPSLANSDLYLKLSSPGRNSVVVGGMKLSDGGWITFSTREVSAGWDLALSRVMLALVPAVGLLIIGSLLVRQTLRPVKMLAQAAERYGYGDRIIVPEVGTGEILRVVRAFNAMQDRIHKLIGDRTQALAAVGHDLRTPVARLLLRVDMIPEEPVREALRRDAQEMEAMIASLLAFLGGDDNGEALVKVDLAAMAETLVDDAQDQGHSIDYRGPDNIEATIRALDIKRALGNLISNALRYGSHVTVAIVQEPERIRLQVIDDGPGIDEDRIDEAMQPFTRLDPARGLNTYGLGLGLAIVRRIAKRSGGRLLLSNRPEGGLIAEIILPIAQQQ